MLWREGPSDLPGKPTEKLFFPPDFFHRTGPVLRADEEILVSSCPARYDQTSGPISNPRSDPLLFPEGRPTIRRSSAEHGMIAKEGKTDSESSSPLDSFGPTLEWFISEMFRREFASPAIYACLSRRQPPVATTTSWPPGIEGSFTWRSNRLRLGGYS